ncbi:carboxymuconolactone decarboxylase family protein [Novosphingobium album (ex Liu et al. 2023)]|uniref:Carboxymuconolactone decarboxylase family protein n=1 Tax=Novosphingobium album (ex Liu et al. 2023) TaxID=3031130 RepID=A0ABT5WRJ2_9SPHN|nr:carboxymuconolactone decarboxylase family protein [Novosphingobium album (ex Liu et al. 2023)]MDE8652659.1 carboxymuconolactone decarboxylase family protein [Novosphingobium album (ex Liu et al. 2023)]
MAEDTHARMAEIVGAPPRVEPLGEDRLDDRHRDAIETLRIIYGYPEGIPLSQFFGVLAHSPDFFAGFMSLGVAATASSALPPRTRELAILRTGWLCGAPYQWGEHVRAAKDAGLTSEEIERVTLGSAAEGWNEEDRAVLLAAEELHARAMVGEANWARLSARFDARQLIELLLIVGHYHMTAFVQNTLRTPLSDHNPGLSAR